MHKIIFKIFFLAVFVFTIADIVQTQAQGIYTARGFWEESNKKIYREIKLKQNIGDPISEKEQMYLEDYERYLDSYFQRLSPSEVAIYNQMKAEWDREIYGQNKPEDVPEEFEWRGRDRAVNIGYGFLYGLSLVAITEPDNVGAIGIPLITGGIWALGPVINPSKYENITRPVLRASNTGKFLGAIYGASLGALVGGDSEGTPKIALGLATFGSIALGEVGFQMQKKKNFSEGHIEMIRHYGILGPWIGLTIPLALQSDVGNLYGGALLSGAALGLWIGNNQSQKYDYTRGDVDNISALSLISTGIGIAIAGEAAFDGGSSGLILIPAAGTVLGTILAQKAVKGVYLTKKQGSTITYSTAGAALVGFGIAALAQSSSPAVVIGLPSVFALATQQILFTKFKRENLAVTLLGKKDQESGVSLSLKFTPENYFLNQKLQTANSIMHVNSQLSNPLVKFRLSF